MRIFRDDELLAVKKREDHRDGNRCSIIESMEEGSGDENLFFHALKEREFILNMFEVVNFFLMGERASPYFFNCLIYIN